jgi:hypothetical protein
MENLKDVLILAAILFPWAVLLIIGVIGFVILVYKEEDTISPSVIVKKVSPATITRGEIMQILVYKWHNEGASLKQFERHPAFTNDTQQIIVWCDDNMDVDIECKDNTYQFMIIPHANPT